MIVNRQNYTEAALHAAGMGFVRAIGSSDPIHLKLLRTTRTLTLISLFYIDMEYGTKTTNSIKV